MSLGKDIDGSKAYCIKLKSGINTSRTDFSFNLAYPLRITLNWLVGFIEGDGSFCFSQLQPRLSIGLHINNMRLITAMKEYIDYLPIMYDRVLGVVSPPKGVIHVPKSVGQSMVSIYWSGIDRLYYYIIPNLHTADFHTRKQADFVSWCIVVKIYKFGYNLTDSGKSL